MTHDCLWTGAELQAALGVGVDARVCATGAEINSRDVEKGDLFFALKGAVSDGHKYVADALDRGAVAAIVHGLPDGVPANDPRLIMVTDTFDALYTLARASRARFEGAVLGVTGSAGKTSTKEALARALARTGETHKSLKSYNNHVGLPLSLVRMPKTGSYAVLEMGMSNAGEIRTLSKLARPHMAIVTSVGGAHQENFASINDIAKAKAEIFEGLEDGGTAVIDGDGLYAGVLKKLAEASGANVCMTSLQKDGHFANSVRFVPHEDCSCLVADVDGLRLAYKVGLPGVHWASNSLLVLAAVHVAGGDIGMAGIELSNLSGLEGRGARTRVVTQRGSFVVADESYNANPISMTAALDVLGLSKPTSKRGERIAILADMLELGDETEAAHMALVEQIKAANVDRLFTTGPAMNALRNQHFADLAGAVAENVDELIGGIKRAIKPGDVVLVKGSNAFGLVGVVDALKALHEDGSSLWVDVVGAAE